MTAWTIGYTNSLPDSSFLWIASGGEKDSEGKTLPRSLRHLPYRDEAGKINKEQIDNADINLSGLPTSAKEKIIRLKSGIVSSSLCPTVVASITITERDGKKVAVVTGELMNIKPNANNWGIEQKDSSIIASDFTDISIRTLHAESEFSVIGTGDSASANEEGAISYELTINNPEAVTKFENKEWNARNMGISPQVSWFNIRCSICGQDLLSSLDNKKELGRSHSGDITHFGCGHVFGKTYDNKLAYKVTMEARLVEATMTTRPAYKIVGSGNISNIDVMAASINDLCSLRTLSKSSTKINTLRGEKDMEDVKTMLAEKSSEIETLRTELSSMKTKSDEALVAEVKLGKETLEAEKTKVSDALKASEKAKKEITELKASVEKATKEAKEKDVFIAKVVKQTRETELAKLISDKELVAKILSVEMTDVQFKAKIEEVTAIKKLSANTDDVGGSTTPEGQTSSAEYEKYFGVSRADHEKELFGGTNVADMNK